jgi:hypothetical protein
VVVVAKRKLAWTQWFCAEAAVSPSRYLETASHVNIQPIFATLLFNASLASVFLLSQAVVKPIKIIDLSHDHGLCNYLFMSRCQIAL